MPYTDEQRELEENILYHTRMAQHHRTAGRRFMDIRDAKPVEVASIVETECKAKEPTMEKAISDIAQAEADIDKQVADETKAKQERADARDLEAERDA